MTTALRQVTIPLQQGVVRVVLRNNGTLLAYAPTQKVPMYIPFDVNDRFRELSDVLTNPARASEAQNVVGAFLMFARSNNHADLQATNPNRVEVFKALLSNAEERFLLEGLTSAEVPAQIPLTIAQKGGHIANVYTDLTEGIVFHVFRKQDGSVRPMLCTRNASLIASITGKPVESVEKALLSRITVAPELINVYSFEAAGFRKFYLNSTYSETAQEIATLKRERTPQGGYGLAWYKLPLSVNARSVTDEDSLAAFLDAQFGALVSPIAAFSDEGALSENYSASEVYSVVDMLGLLRTNVVRVALNLDGKARVMYATRNPELMETYKKLGALDKPEREDNRTPAEKMNAIVESRIIPVFDLEVQEFRSIAVDKIMAMDATQPVPGWIEYDAQIGDWYATMRGTRTVTETYASAFKGKAMRTIDTARLRFEAQQFKFQSVKADAMEMAQEDTSYLARIAETDRVLAQVLAQAEHTTMTSQDLEAFETFKVFADHLEEDFKAKSLAGNLSGRLVLSEKNVALRSYLVKLVFNWGQDVIYIHPRFIVSASSHRVWADRTGLFEASLPRARTSRVDKMLEPLLGKISPLVTGRRRADLFTKPVVGDDIRRVARLDRLLKQHAAELKANQITISRVKDLPAQFKVTIERKQFVLMNHEYVYHNGRKGFWFLRTKETTYANSLEPILAQVEGKEAMVLTMLAHACDLRRQVLDDKGNPM